NHDHKSALWYTEHGFHFAADAMLFRGVWCTHKPWRYILPEGAYANLHGHLHNVWDGFVNNDPEKYNDEFSLAHSLGRLEQRWQRLFAVEYTDYKPVEFDTFMAKGHEKFQSTGPKNVAQKREQEEIDAEYKRN